MVREEPGSYSELRPIGDESKAKRWSKGDLAAALKAHEWRIWLTGKGESRTASNWEVILEEALAPNTFRAFGHCLRQPSPVIREWATPALAEVEEDAPQLLAFLHIPPNEFTHQAWAACVDGESEQDGLGRIPTSATTKYATSKRIYGVLQDLDMSTASMPGSWSKPSTSECGVKRPTFSPCFPRKCARGLP